MSLNERTFADIIWTIENEPKHDSLAASSLRALFPRLLGSTLVIRDSQFIYNVVRKDTDLVLSPSHITDWLFILLARSYPELTELTVIFSHLSSWTMLPALLRHLGQNISTLRLDGVIGFSYLPDQIATSIVSLPNLSSFALYGYDLSRHLIRLLGPVLTNLEQLAFPNSSPFDGPNITSFLSPKCTWLMINMATFVDFSEDFLPMLSTNLTHLHLAVCSNDPKCWPRISLLTGLTWITLDYSNSVSLSLFVSCFSLTFQQFLPNIAQTGRQFNSQLSCSLNHSHRCTHFQP